ncbi:hypothetical protein CCOS01_11669 [Colletotrichum costaricense]|uniref:Uncharacterized protein n=1 Tax=Colletotrichum costaricense TaxID=1209916 RepID=A0AAJ0DWN7_9PEZI|nr:hypothetical protein CCOS01_11669 [Colletotrichum costaricense]
MDRGCKIHLFLFFLFFPSFWASI